MAEQAIEHYFRDGYAIGVTLGTEEELKDRIITRIYDPTSPITPLPIAFIPHLSFVSLTNALFLTAILSVG